MWETFLSVLVVVAILGSAAVVTQLFARATYDQCPSCRTLNAKRRDQCRNCGQPLAEI